MEKAKQALGLLLCPAAECVVSGFRGAGSQTGLQGGLEAATLKADTGRRRYHLFTFIKDLKNLAA